MGSASGAGPALPAPRCLQNSGTAARPRWSQFGGSAASAWGPGFLPGTAVLPAPPSAACSGPPCRLTTAAALEVGGGLPGFKGAGAGVRGRARRHSSEAGLAWRPRTCVSRSARLLCVPWRPVRARCVWSQERATRTTRPFCDNTARSAWRPGAAWSGACRARRTAMTRAQHCAPAAPGGHARGHASLAPRHRVPARGRPVSHARCAASACGLAGAPTGARPLAASFLTRRPWRPLRSRAAPCGRRARSQRHVPGTLARGTRSVTSLPGAVSTRHVTPGPSGAELQSTTRGQR